MILDWFRRFWGKSGFYSSNQTWKEYYKAKEDYEKRNKK